MSGRADTLQVRIPETLFGAFFMKLFSSCLSEIEFGDVGEGSNMTKNGGGLIQPSDRIPKMQKGIGMYGLCLRDKL